MENTIFRLTQLLKDSSNKIFVAEINSQIVVYVHGVDYNLFYCDHLKNIMGIAVYSIYRRKGIGKLLIEAIENWGKETCALGIRLNSGVHRISAQKFYENCGFELKKHQMNFFKKIK